MKKRICNFTIISIFEIIGMHRKKQRFITIMSNNHEVCHQPTATTERSFDNECK